MQKKFVASRLCLFYDVAQYTCIFYEKFYAGTLKLVNGSATFIYGNVSNKIVNVIYFYCI